MSALERVLSLVENVHQAKENQWEALCPAHDDRARSLAVAQGRKGVVVTCYAGCEVDAICAAIGIELKDLFDPEDAPAPIVAVARPQPLPTIAEVDTWARRIDEVGPRLAELKRWSLPTLRSLGVGYDGRRLTIPVVDARGTLVNLVRYSPAPARSQPKSIALRGHPRDLWPPPEGFPRGLPLTIVEGEADAISGREMGMGAVAVPGANGWKDDMAARFAGRYVVVCCDCDASGRALAGRVAHALRSVTRFRIVDLDPTRSDGFDISDQLVSS